MGFHFRSSLNQRKLKLTKTVRKRFVKQPKTDLSLTLIRKIAKQSEFRFRSSKQQITIGLKHVMNRRDGKQGNKQKSEKYPVITKKPYYREPTQFVSVNILVHIEIEVTCFNSVIGRPIWLHSLA
jgi:hypothetical protein